MISVRAYLVAVAGVVAFGAAQACPFCDDFGADNPFGRITTPGDAPQAQPVSAPTTEPQRLPAAGTGAAPGAALVPVAAGEGQDWIVLRGKTALRFQNAGELKGNDAAGQRGLYTNFELRDPAAVKAGPDYLALADDVFGRFVILTAEQNGFTRVAVNFQRPGKAGAPTYETFFYQRGKDAVWLRQKGAEPWKTAQDAAYAVKPLEVFKAPGLGTIEVEAVAEIVAPKGAKRALGIDIRTDTPHTNSLLKYREMRAAWLKADRKNLLDKGFDHVVIQNFTGKRLGRFQVREMVYLTIRREAGKDWPALPETLPGKPGGKLLTAEAPKLDTQALNTAIAQAFQAEPAPLTPSFTSALAGLSVGNARAVASLAPADDPLAQGTYKPQ